MSGGIVPPDRFKPNPHDVPFEDDDSFGYVNNATFAAGWAGMPGAHGSMVPLNKSVRLAGGCGKSITMIVKNPIWGNEYCKAARSPARTGADELRSWAALESQFLEVGAPNPAQVIVDDWDATACANQWRLVEGSRLRIDQNKVVMQPAPSNLFSSDNARAMAHIVGVGVVDFFDNYGFEMLGAVLPDLSRSDRFVAHPDVNVVHKREVDSLVRTAAVLKSAAKLDDREVSILEAKQQRNAILLAKDFRAALQVLMDEEQFSNYDLSVVIGVTRAVLTGWRARPQEKLWGTSHTRMGRLLFAWKYWLHVAEGEPLGMYLRDVPETSATSLLDLLSQKDPTEEEIASHIDRLAAYAKEDRRAAAERRRDIGGLPDSAYRKDVAFD